jgi:hypothetical protein
MGHVAEKTSLVQNFEDFGGSSENFVVIFLNCIGKPGLLPCGFHWHGKASVTKTFCVILAG